MSEPPNEAGPIMMPRERLLTSLNHQTPDRVAIDLASTQVTGISVSAYTRLRQYLGLPALAPVISDAIQQICLPHADVLQRFGVDTRGLFPLMNHNQFVDQVQGDYLVHTDEWGFIYRRHSRDGLWYDLVNHPLAQQPLSQQLIDTFAWPKGGNANRIQGLRQQAQQHREQGFAVVLKSVCAGLFEMMIRLRGMENALTDLLLDPVNAGRLLDRVLQHKLEYWRCALSELGEMVDVAAEGDDFGTQTSQLISVKTWRDLFKDRQAELVRTIKSLAPQTKVFFHSCGSIRDLLPEFIDMGIDIINPVHLKAAGMEAKSLKRDFGKDIVFWGGGIDTQDTLPNASPARVQAEVKANLEILAQEGGYVFNTIHNIQADVPPQNIVAMYEAVLS